MGSLPLQAVIDLGSDTPPPTPVVSYDEWLSQQPSADQRAARIVAKQSEAPAAVAAGAEQKEANASQPTCDNCGEAYQGTAGDLFSHFCTKPKEPVSMVGEKPLLSFTVRYTPPTRVPESSSDDGNSDTSPEIDHMEFLEDRMAQADYNYDKLKEQLDELNKLYRTMACQVDALLDVSDEHSKVLAKMKWQMELGPRELKQATMEQKVEEPLPRFRRNRDGGIGCVTCGKPAHASAAGMLWCSLCYDLIGDEYVESLVANVDSTEQCKMRVRWSEALIKSINSVDAETDDEIAEDLGKALDKA